MGLRSNKPRYERRPEDWFPPTPPGTPTATDLSGKVDTTTEILAGTGMSGGGPLSGDVTLSIDTSAEAERIRDVIGAAIVAGANITVTVNDAGDTITIASSGGSSYTDENAQDAVGGILTDTSTIDFTYNDASNQITADVKAGSIGDTEINSSAEAERIRDIIGTALVAGSNVTITVNDAGDTITIASTGGSSRLSVTEDFYRIIAEANMTIGHGASGTLFNKVVDKGGLVILALGGSTQSTTWRTGTSYVVPTGKVALIVDAKFSPNVMNNWSFYKHRLFNVTTSSSNVAANANGSGSGVNSVNGYSNFVATWPTPDQAVNSDIPFPVQVATAGQSIRAELAGNADSNSRPVFGMYVLAIIDTTTHLMGTLS